MKLHTVSCNVGYPLYGARFLEDNTLLFAGGGGEGKNGIPNKLPLLGVRNGGAIDSTDGKPGKPGEETLLGRSSDDENSQLRNLVSMSLIHRMIPRLLWIVKMVRYWLDVTRTVRL